MQGPLCSWVWRTDSVARGRCVVSQAPKYFSDQTKPRNLTHKHPPIYDKDEKRLSGKDEPSLQISASKHCLDCKKQKKNRAAKTDRRDPWNNCKLLLIFTLIASESSLPIIWPQSLCLLLHRSLLPTKLHEWPKQPRTCDLRSTRHKLCNLCNPSLLPRFEREHNSCLGLFTSIPPLATTIPCWYSSRRWDFQNPFAET